MMVNGAATAVAVRVLEHRLAEVAGPIEGRAPRVLLDLADITFIDRTGLDMLLDWQELGRRSRRRRHQPRLAVVGTPVSPLITSTVWPCVGVRSETD